MKLVFFTDSPASIVLSRLYITIFLCHQHHRIISDYSNISGY